MIRKFTVAVVGAGHEIEPAISNASKLGELIAKEGWVVISGGRNAGVMKAVNEGAKRIPGSLTIGILPTSTSDIAACVDIPIVTDMHQARNNIITLSGSIIVACGVDGPGTTSEIALALKNGKKVILLSADEHAISFFQRLDNINVLTAQTPEEAIQIIRDLHFH